MSVRRQESSMKSDLLAMFEVGQAERKSHPPVGTSDTNLRSKMPF
jgi:hypothetical protein